MQPGCRAVNVRRRLDTMWRHGCTFRAVTWSAYGAFLALAVVLVLIPGPDFAVVVKNTLTGGRRRGTWAAVGVASSNCVQGAAAAAGLGAAIVAAKPLFEAIRWAGVAYLALLGLQALRSAIGRNDDREHGYLPTPGQTQTAALRGWRQGFLSNITNPKVLVFYLAVLPQFLQPHAPLVIIFGLAVTHAVLSLLYLIVLVTGLHRVRRALLRRRVRRALDGVTGISLIGFSAALAAEHQ